MLTHKLFPIFALFAMAQTYGLHRRQYQTLTGREVPNIQKDRNPILLSGEDGSDQRRLFFVSSHDSYPDSEKISAGLEIFGIPIGPQFSYTKEKDPKEEYVQPILVPIETMYNTDGGHQANYQQEVVRVPVTHMKQQIIYAKQPALQTFPFEQEPRETVVIPGDQTRKSERLNAAAGLQFFGIPIGSQIVYSSNKDDDDGISDGERYTVVHPLLSSNQQMGNTKLAGQMIVG